MRYGSLVEVTAVVQLVAVELFPSGTAPPSGEAVAFVCHTGCQVAVGFLCCSYYGNDTVEIMVQFRVVFYCQGIRRSFYDFIWIRVVERKIAAVFSLHEAGCDGEVVKAAVLLTLPESGWDGDCPVCLYSRGPEPVLNVYLGKRNFPDRGVRVVTDVPGAGNGAYGQGRCGQYCCCSCGTVW